VSLRKYWSDKVREIIKQKGTRLVLALDEFPFGDFSREECAEVLSRLVDYLVGIKVGVPLMIKYGVFGVAEIVESLKKNSECILIYDGKISDIYHVNKKIANMVFSVGFDLVIAHGIVGYKGGIEGVVEVARNFKGGVLILAAMSHEESWILNRNLMEILRRYSKVDGVVGFILPATKPSTIRIAREFLGNDFLIFSPGAGKQGAPYGQSIAVGADIEIVGRGIYESINPMESVVSLMEVYRQYEGK